MPIWLLLHLLGFTLWLGGGFAAMIMGIAAKKEPRERLPLIIHYQALVHKAAIGPGAILTVLSGIILTFRLSSAYYAGANLWLIIMQGGGLIAALLVLFIAMPTISKLDRLDAEGPGAAYWDELRMRHRVVGAAAGIIGLIALFAGAMVRG